MEPLILVPLAIIFLALLGFTWMVIHGGYRTRLKYGAHRFVLEPSLSAKRKPRSKALPPPGDDASSPAPTVVRSE
ncbi:MAG: hypothetical protein JNL82_32870 [Myxococcales bacterium]|jgi:hypothetical protein|nr:hypothetical protein [Myxococcales bacterium]